MSDYAASGNGGSEVPEFSLTRAVEEIRQHGFAQIESLSEKQKTLSSLQATLLETEEKDEMVEKDLRSTIRDILAKEAGMEQLEQQEKVLNDRRTLVGHESADLRRRIGEEEEHAGKVLARFSAYRTKMEGHRVAVRLAASRRGAEELEEKEAFVRKLKERREALREDLDNPNGSTVEEAKGEIRALEAEVSTMRRTAAEKRERLLEEAEAHARIKEDTEIHNRRFEAVVRRLRLQLSRAQAAHRCRKNRPPPTSLFLTHTHNPLNCVFRQVCDDVRRLERELAQLKLRL